MAEPRIFYVTVRYRTSSGCDTKNYEIEAEDMEVVIKTACDKLRQRRGVIRIDGGYCIDIDPVRMK